MGRSERDEVSDEYHGTEAANGMNNVSEDNVENSLEIEAEDDAIRMPMQTQSSPSTPTGTRDP